MGIGLWERAVKVHKGGADSTILLYSYLQVNSKSKFLFTSHHTIANIIWKRELFKLWQGGNIDTWEEILQVCVGLVTAQPTWSGSKTKPIDFMLTKSWKKQNCYCIEQLVFRKMIFIKKLCGAVCQCCGFS